MLEQWSVDHCWTKLFHPVQGLAATPASGLIYMLCSWLWIMNASLVATSVKGKVTYTYKLTELIATLLKSCSTLSEPTSQSSILFSRHRKTENLASKQGLEWGRHYSKKTPKYPVTSRFPPKQLEHIPFLNIIFSKKSFQNNCCADIMKSWVRRKRVKNALNKQERCDHCQCFKKPQSYNFKTTS